MAALLSVSLGLCQVAIRKSEAVQPGPAGPIEVHQLFFDRVAHSNSGRPFTFPSDLTNAEIAILNNVAADCDSKLRPLSENPVVLEARMRFVESGEKQEDWLNQRLADLKARRDRVIVEHIEALRASLGEPRFQVLETVIQTWHDNLTVAGATGTGATPTRKK
jgi:hypothetical protein